MFVPVLAFAADLYAVNKTPLFYDCIFAKLPKCGSILTTWRVAGGVWWTSGDLYLLNYTHMRCVCTWHALLIGFFLQYNTNQRRCSSAGWRRWPRRLQRYWWYPPSSPCMVSQKFQTVPCSREVADSIAYGIYRVGNTVHTSPWGELDVPSCVTFREGCRNRNRSGRKWNDCG